MRVLIVIVALVTVEAAAITKVEDESRSDYSLLQRMLSQPSAGIDTESGTDSKALPSDISPQCRNDVHLMSQQRFKALWAFKMFDSSSKIPTGILSGVLQDLGNFDECIGVKANDNHDFDGQYCIVSFSPNLNGEQNTLNNHAVNLIFNKSRANIPGGGEMQSALSQLALRVAWCMPSSCSPDDISKIATYRVRALRFLKGSTSPNVCHTWRRPALEGLDIAVICILSLFATIAIGSTVFDVLTIERKNRSQLLLAFSLYSNGSKLVAVSRKGDQIWCLHGMRFLSICWVIMGHRYTWAMEPPSLNAFEIPAFFTEFKRLPITNATLSVDTFFVMSGLLLSFLFLKEVEKSGRFDVFKFYIHRYIRLTPPVAVMILVTMTLVRLAGSGPLWNTMTSTDVENCKKNWWLTLLYVNSYINTDNKCLSHTWYLSVDMQLYWLSPIVLLVLWKKRKFAIYWITFLFLAGIAIPFAIIYTKKLLAAPSIKYFDKYAKTQRYYYTPAYTRFNAWLVGVALGAVLHAARKRRTRLHPIAVLCGWVCGVGLMVGSVVSMYPFMQTDYAYDPVEAAFHGSLFRPMWALGVAWVVFACDQGYGGIVNTFLSWGFFQPLSRLSYGLYLTHLAWLNVWLGSTRTVSYLADVFLIPQFFGDLLMAIAWTIPLVLLFESPILTLEKIAFGHARREAASDRPIASLGHLYGETDQKSGDPA